MFVKEIYERVLKKKIKDIDDYLYSIRFKNPDIDKMYKYSIQSGKRLRPLLTMLSFEAVKGKSQSIIPVASSIELLHKASLIHDDLIDKDDYRRGKKTFHKRFGMEKAVIMGDLLVAIVFENLIRKKNIIKNQKIKKQYIESIETIITTFRLLATGEIEEEILKDKHKIKESEIEDVLYGKTAVLIETCFRIGSILGNGTQKEIQMLSSFGKNIGLAFQTINDINNIDGVEKRSKKTLFTDIRQKKKNFVILHALNGKGKKRLISLLNKKELSGEDVEEIFKIILKNKSLDYSKKIVTGYLTDAKKSLDSLRPSPTKKILLDLIDKTANRWFWKT